MEEKIIMIFVGGIVSFLMAIVLFLVKRLFSNMDSMQKEIHETQVNYAHKSDLRVAVEKVERAIENLGNNIIELMNSKKDK